MSDIRAILDAAHKADAAGNGDEARALLALASKVRARSQQPSSRQAPTLQDRSDSVFGFKDYQTRGTILPVGRTKEGELELAWPQVAVDMAESALLPGHVAQGGQYTDRDVTKFALDYGVPATSRSGMTVKSRVPSKKEFVQAAPTIDRLKQESSDFYRAAADGGLVVSPDSYTRFLDNMQARMIREGFDEDLHADASTALKAMHKKRGGKVDVEDLKIAREQIGDALEASKPRTRRIAEIMRENLDEYVDGLADADLVGGEVAGAGDKLRKARSLWSRAKKSETIAKVLSDAELQASGFENGVRIGFRALLKNPKKVRGFSEDERNLMRQIVEGTSGQKLMRLVAKLSFVKSDAGNLVGGSIGSGAGATIGSSLAGAPGAFVGAAVPPAVGYVAQKGAEKSVSGQTALLNALAATGKRMPKKPASQTLVGALMSRGTGPLAGTILPEQEWY